MSRDGDCTDLNQPGAEGVDAVMPFEQSGLDECLREPARAGPRKIHCLGQLGEMQFAMEVTEREE